MAGSSGGAAAGSGGSAAGSGGAAAGSGGSAAGSGGAAAGSGGSAAGSGGSGGGTTAYNCTRVVGASQVKEWYEYDYQSSYFETLVPNDKWELKAASLAQLDRWSDPNHEIWKDVKDNAASAAIPIYSPCANNTPPDRIAAFLLAYSYKTRAEWDTGLAKFIDNIKSKYPTVKRIVLFTATRCSVTTCPETANLMPPGNTCRVYPMIDEAMEAAAAAAQPPGFVTVGPKMEHNVCGDFVDPTTSGHLKKGPVQAVVAKKVADYFNMP